MRTEHGRWAAGDRHLLELVVSEETYPAAVGRKERSERAFSAWNLRRLQFVERVQIQARHAFALQDVHETRTIRRNRQRQLPQPERHRPRAGKRTLLWQTNLQPLDARF